MKRPFKFSVVLKSTSDGSQRDLRKNLRYRNVMPVAVMSVQWIPSAQFSSTRDLHTTRSG